MTAAPVSKRAPKRRNGCMVFFYKALKLLWSMFGPRTAFKIFLTPFPLFSIHQRFLYIPLFFLGIIYWYISPYSKGTHLLNWQNFSNFKCLHQDFFNWKSENLFLIWENYCTYVLVWQLMKVFHHLQNSLDWPE